ncbi:MAG: GIY-YIG nuclease family protein [Gammaproteobacteria bacterium]|nr:GIY-YIG nuclease family protein [Gammaproteobacteria bacterium]
MSEIQYWVYILLCDNDSFYTGYTTDMARRYQEHVSGTDKCKYTRSFKPIRIARCWQILGDKSTALQMERFIKKLSRRQKEKLIAQPTEMTKLFPCQVMTVE